MFGTGFTFLLGTHNLQIDFIFSGTKIIAATYAAAKFSENFKLKVYAKLKVQIDFQFYINARLLLFS